MRDKSEPGTRRCETSAPSGDPRPSWAAGSPAFRVRAPRARDHALGRGGRCLRINAPRDLLSGRYVFGGKGSGVCDGSNAANGVAYPLEDLRQRGGSSHWPNEKTARP